MPNTTPPPSGDQPELNATTLARRLIAGESLSDIFASARPTAEAVDQGPCTGQHAASGGQDAQEPAHEALSVTLPPAPVSADASAGEPSAPTIEAAIEAAKRRKGKSTRNGGFVK